MRSNLAAFVAAPCVRRRAFVATSWTAGALVLAGLIGCEGDDSPVVAPEPESDNRLPTVEVTRGLTEGAIVSATDTEIEVDGTDVDGEVVGFRYAIDPGPDTVWLDVEERRIRPRFTATEPQYGGLSSSAHTMAFVAIDNHGGVSEPLSIRFLAQTITPTITLIGRDPVGDDQVAEYGPEDAIGFDWAAGDVDGPDDVPLRAQWKLILLPDGPMSAEDVLSELRGQPDDQPNLLIPAAWAIPWGESLPTDAHVRETDWWPPRESASDEVRFEIPEGLVTPGLTYAVAARAIDAALAVTAHGDLAVRENGESGNVIRIRRGER